MSGINNAMNNALSGLEAFEAGISTVSNNIANANTPGYAVETTDIETEFSPSGQFGMGVEPAQVTRAASGFAAAQVRSANTANAAASEQSTSLTAISNALTNDGDVQSAMNQFFSDISSLASNPSSQALRQTVLSDGQMVVSSFQSASTSINNIVSGSQETLSTGVAAANNLLVQLNQINKLLGQSPNDPSLLDKQQSALNSLSNYLPIHALTQRNGSVIIASGGTVLLDQSGVQTLALNNEKNGIIAGTNNSSLYLSDSDGSLGGALGTISAGTQANSSLNNLAIAFATQVNYSQAQGLDENGNIGQKLFLFSTTSSIGTPIFDMSVSASSPSQIAAADPYVASPGAIQDDGSIIDTNAGNVTIGSDSVVSTPASGAAIVPSSYFGKTLQINFTSSNSYTITAPPSSKEITSGRLSNNSGTIAVEYPSGEYWQLPISGSPEQNDSLTLQPGGSSSGSNAQRMAALWTAQGTGSSASLQQQAIGLSSELGENASAATQVASATTSQLSTAQTNLTNVAGVNTDQQAVILSNYEQAYQAAAQVISTAHSMFESLINAI